MGEAVQIGRRIRRFRELAGLSKSELARRVGVSPTAVNNWEENGVMPRLDLLMQIANVLEMDVIQLATGEPGVDMGLASRTPPPPAGRRDRLEELKRQIAELFGVSHDNVEITIKA